MAIYDMMNGLGGYAPYLFVLFGAIGLCWRLLSSSPDPREPPSIKPSIPIVGHIIGLFRHKMAYLEMLSAKSQSPINSLQMGPAKVHVIMSPDVVQTALRNRTLSFDPFSMAFARRVVGAKSEKFRTICYTPASDKEDCYNNDMHKVYHEPMQPGPELQQTNAAVLRQVSKFMNNIGPEYEQKELYMWLRDSFTVATSIALFGSRNPFSSDPSLTPALWDFEAGVQMLMLDFLPYFTAHKAHVGRTKVQAALRAYFRAGHDLDDDVSPFIKRRTLTERKYGFDSDEFGDWDLAMMMVATTNAIPTLFWTIIYVLSSPGVTASIREEVLRITSSRPPAATAATDAATTGQTTRMVIDAAKFSTHCPLLCAAYQESMRLSNRQMSLRVAEADTSLSAAGRTYLVKKDAVVLIPSSLYSEDPKIWGSNAHAFEPERWLKRSAQKESSEVADAKDAERLQKKAFFPFGGGRHLCPGRHFAFAEILGMVALLVVGYDIINVPDQPGAPGGLGEVPLKVPMRESRFFGEAVPKPVGNYNVLLRRKKEFEGVTWAFDFGSSGGGG